MVHAIRSVMTWILFVLVIFIGPALFIKARVVDNEMEYMRYVSDTFLDRVSAKGTLTYNDYLTYADSIAKLNKGYEVQALHRTYIDTPYYDVLSANEIVAYYAARNIRNKIELEQDFSLPVVQEEEALTLQEESNATVFSALTGEYVPLPDEGAVTNQVTYTAVRPNQIVYENEPLITVCLKESPSGYQYIVADAVAVSVVGTRSVELTVNGVPTGAFVSVQVYPRKLRCDNGHRYACTKEVIANKESTGVWSGCPYCMVEVESITFLPANVVTKVGTDLFTAGLRCQVTYLDGHAEEVLPNVEGFTTTYDSSYCGTQPVSVSYKGVVQDGLTVTTKGGTCVKCGLECSSRNYADYLQEKCCERCLSGSPFFYGTTYVEESVTTMQEIEQLLQQEGEYPLSRNSYFELFLYQTGQDSFFDYKEGTLVYRCGTVIRSEMQVD